MYVFEPNYAVSSAEMLTHTAVRACLTLLGPAAAERQPSGAPATRSVAGGAAQNFFEMGHIVRQVRAARTKGFGQSKSLAVDVDQL